MLEALGFGMSALVLSYLGVVGLRRWAERRQMLDIPNERSSHTRPTPRGGGLAIVLVVLVGWLVALRLYPDAPVQAGLIYAVGAGLIAAVSWLDDLRSLSNRVRFAAHMLGAVLAIWAFGYWTDITVPLIGSLHLGLLGLPITFLWIVGLTNAYNFMDGIDGIAGGQAVVAGSGWAVVGWLTDQPLLGIMGVLLAAASLGFLGQNWPPARIFMGDVGSAFLGFTFAVLAVAAAQRDARLAVGGHPVCLALRVRRNFHVSASSEKWRERLRRASFPPVPAAGHCRLRPSVRDIALHWPGGLGCDSGRCSGLRPYPAVQLSLL